MVRRTIYSLAAVAVACITFATVWVSAKTTPPGLERYTPTRLEWAALELQASHGDTWGPTAETVMISYRPGTDGLTVVCVIQYTAGASSSLLGMVRDTTKQVFEIYKNAKKWPWLRLEFQEKELG
jgi:hypothetical protein